MTETDVVRRLLGELASLTADAPGVTRAAYGAGEAAAHALFASEGERLGAEVGADPAGNLTMRFEGRARGPATLVGSHLDSVPHGGNFDGAAGVAGGLAAMAGLAVRGARPAHDVIVAAFRAEEAAWFPLSYPGALAAIGRLPAAALDARRTDTGRTLAEHMAEAGFDPKAVAAGHGALDARGLRAAIEIHIEQGPVLDGAGESLGLVNAIAGGARLGAARIEGAWDHSGAAPFGARADAVAAFADIVSGANADWAAMDADGRAATLTFGRVQTDADRHGGSVVAGGLGFSVDVRAADPVDIARLETALRARGATAEAAHGVRLDWGPRMDWPGAAMDAGLLDGLERAARRLGLAPRRMPSGAGHDAAALAEAGIPTAMIFVASRNGSHNPAEAMEMEHLGSAARLLGEWLEEGE